MSITIKLPEELINQLSEFDKHTGEIMDAALTAGAKVACKQAKTNLSFAIGSGTKEPSQSTGELVRALGVTPVKPDRDGWNVRVGFAEPRRDGKSNAMVANILEYGSRKHNQPARPFMKPAADSTKAAAKAEIKRVFDEEAKKYLKMKG
ncbi:HK97 gp10 family phage protein [Oscillibacter sp. MSJ-2]|uniref:HK97 gp10 family phage protein n=1 Tax=Dysosmobacter acutus TaxID=2841504 RepID=A0ABS6FBQ9_9FIRM|nr:HK97 gp10 family phage protein [Dysosmobacter acutus]MBU5627707.1 HK97 gp10 family phage protein [Dysosmobacter acutus]